MRGAYLVNVKHSDETKFRPGQGPSGPLPMLIVERDCPISARRKTINESMSY